MFYLCGKINSSFPKKTIIKSLSIKIIFFFYHNSLLYRLQFRDSNVLPKLEFMHQICEKDTLLIIFTLTKLNIRLHIFNLYLYVKVQN